jgi:hypothetical protein
LLTRADEPPAVPSGPSCGPECHKITYQLHWVERKVPCTETKYALRELNHSDTQHGLEVDYHRERQVKTELVLKKRVCMKEVTICTQKPIATTDPVTGCSKIIFQPITETKLVPEVRYELVPEEREVMVATPMLRPTTTPIVRKTFVLEPSTEHSLRTERVPVLVPVEITERKVPCAPPPPPAGPTPPELPSSGR